MRQVSIKNLYGSLSANVERLPFEITRYGKVVGVMCTLEHYKRGLDEKPPDVKIHEDGLDNKPEKEEAEADGLDKSKKTEPPDDKGLDKQELTPRQKYQEAHPNENCLRCRYPNKDCRCGK